MNQLIIIISFAVFLAIFTLIGVLSSRWSKASSEDYLVASRNVNPWLIALSAVSTNNSGYMFIGLIGFTWRAGVEAVWITFGWILGDLLTWFWVHKRVRRQSEEIGAASVPSLLATDHNGGSNRVILIASGILTFLFLGGYAAAQLKAGSMTLHALFGWPLWLGAVLGVAIVTVYCMSGGIRASIWTDAAQSVVMLGAMTMLVGVCMLEVGGFSTLFAKLNAIDPNLVDFMPHGLAFGIGLYVLGFVFAGVATIGQPHILIRFMAIDATESIKKARNIYFLWYTFFSAAALVAGLYARVLLPDLGDGLSPAGVIAATESALPTLSVKMLPPILIGVMLAGLFSATMSCRFTNPIVFGSGHSGRRSPVAQIVCGLKDCNACRGERRSNHCSYSEFGSLLTGAHRLVGPRGHTRADLACSPCWMASLRPSCIIDDGIGTGHSHRLGLIALERCDLQSPARHDRTAGDLCHRDDDASNGGFAGRTAPHRLVGDRRN